MTLCGRLCFAGWSVGHNVKPDTSRRGDVRRLRVLGVFAVQPCDVQWPGAPCVLAVLPADPEGLENLFRGRSGADGAVDDIAFEVLDFAHDPGVLADRGPDALIHQ